MEPTSRTERHSQAFQYLALLLALPTLAFWLARGAYALGWEKPYLVLFARFQFTGAGHAFLSFILIILPLGAFALSAANLKDDRHRLAMRRIFAVLAAVLIGLTVAYWWEHRW